MFPAVVCTLAAVACVLGIVRPTAKILHESLRTGAGQRPIGDVDPVVIHAASALLMMPQTVTVTFMLVWLINHHCWSVAQAEIGDHTAAAGARLSRSAAGRTMSGH